MRMGCPKSHYFVVEDLMEVLFTLCDDNKVLWEVGLILFAQSLQIRVFSLCYVLHLSSS